MTHDERYSPHDIILSKHKLFINNSSVCGSIEHDLKSVHIRSPDAPDAKSCDPAGLHCCCQLEIYPTGLHRKLYFLSFNTMQEVIDKIV